MKQQVYFLNGVDTTSMTYAHDILSALRLVNKFDIQPIGDQDGFEYKDLYKYFRPLKESEKHYTIIINCHGFKDNGCFTLAPKVLSRSQGEWGVESVITDNITPKQLFTKIIEATNNKPLHIMLLSCFSEYIHDYIDLLPKFSKIVSINDKDVSLNILDVLALNFENIFKILMNDDFKLEHILTSLCLNQKMFQTTPVVSFKLASGEVKAINLVELTENYILVKMSKKFSPEFEKLFEKGIVDKLRLENLVSKVKSGTKILELKMPIHIAEQIIKSSDKIIEFNADFEQKYYYKDDLRNYDYAHFFMKLGSLKERKMLF